MTNSDPNVVAPAADTVADRSSEASLAADAQPSHAEGPKGSALTLGGRLSRLRKEAGLRQLDLANTIGVSRPALAQWETDTTQPSLEKILVLSGILQCSPTYLAFGTTASKQAECHSISVQRYEDSGAPVSSYWPLQDEIRSKLSLGLHCYKVLQIGLNICNRYVKTGDHVLLDVTVDHVGNPGLYAWTTDDGPCVGMLIPMPTSKTIAALLHVDGYDHLIPNVDLEKLIGKVVMTFSLCN